MADLYSEPRRTQARSQFKEGTVYYRTKHRDPETGRITTIWTMQERRRILDTGKKFNPEHSLRHDDQQRQDRIARSIPDQGLRRITDVALPRGNPLEPRGIMNPGVYCYQNSVYQTLMHTPMFLKWIDTHVRVDKCRAKKGVRPPCVRCNIRGLAVNYWSPDEERSDPLSRSNPYIKNIRQAAWSRFDKSAHEDASEFYNWIVEVLDDEEDERWHEEWIALYSMSFREYYECRRCGAQRPGSIDSPEFSLEIGVRGVDTVDEAIKRHLGPDKVSVYCDSRQCRKVRGGTAHDRHKQITAGPRILRVTLKITEYQSEGYKIKKRFELAENLDLTDFQVVHGVPLRYKLASVISHQGKTLGSGHYVASVRSFYASRHQFYNINDGEMQGLHRSEFLSNPQIPRYFEEGPGFQVYTLTYLMDERPLDNIRKSSKNAAPEIPNIRARYARLDRS